MALYTDILEDNSAVSPVIGVILMVAVAVILAAVIGATTLDLTEKVGDNPPQVSFETEQSNESIIDGDPDRTEPYTVLTITHSGGEDIYKGDISIEVNGKPAYATFLPAQDFYSVTSSTRHDPLNPWDSIENETISSGDKTNIMLATETIEESDVEIGEDNIGFDHDGSTLIRCGGFGCTYELGTDSGARLSSGDVVRIIWESGDRTYPLLEEEIS